MKITPQPDLIYANVTDFNKGRDQVCHVSIGNVFVTKPSWRDHFYLFIGQDEYHCETGKRYFCSQPCCREEVV